jgi:uncharacterized protein (DUF4415 family)
MKGTIMKKAISSDLPEESRRQLAALAAMAEEDIDTSDIPEVLDWAGAKRGLFYRPVKQQLTLRLDADVIDWFRREGTGYQSRMNAALREYVSRKSGKNAA